MRTILLIATGGTIASRPTAAGGLAPAITSQELLSCVPELAEFCRIDAIQLYNLDSRFACLVWANEPLGSGQLVALANEALGWKKSTTYTVLKKLCERGILHNANGTVTALVKQAQVQQEESAAVVQKSFGGSLPRFVAAFLNTSSISEEEAAAIRAMLDDARRQDSDA